MKLACLFLLVAAACATSSATDSPSDQPTPDEGCGEWRIEVSNGGPSEVSVYYHRAGIRTFLDIVGPNSMRTFFVTLDTKPALYLTVERSGNYPMSVNQSKLIKRSVTCAQSGRRLPRTGGRNLFIVLGPAPRGRARPRRIVRRREASLRTR